MKPEPFYPDCGKVIARKKFSRKQLLAYTANLRNEMPSILKDAKEKT